MNLMNDIDDALGESVLVITCTFEINGRHTRDEMYDIDTPLYGSPRLTRLCLSDTASSWTYRLFGPKPPFAWLNVPYARTSFPELDRLVTMACRLN